MTPMAEENKSPEKKTGGLFGKTRGGRKLTREEIREIKAGRKKLRAELRKMGERGRKEFETTASSMGLYFDRHRSRARLAWFLSANGAWVLLGVAGVLVAAIAGFALLADALCEIDVRIEADKSAYTPALPQTHTVYAPWQVADLPRMDVPIASADGYMSAEYVWAYPPGIPLVVPGELVTDELLAALDAMQDLGTELHSTRGGMPETLYVVEETE